jgi:hypothetical protein
MYHAGRPRDRVAGMPARQFFVGPMRAGLERRMCLLMARDTSKGDAGGNAKQCPEQQARERYHDDEPVRQRGRNLAVGFRRKGRADQMR